MDIQDYRNGYTEGERVAEYFDEREVPEPQFEDSASALYRKGWWDGFNKLKFDPGGQGLFPTDEERHELAHEKAMQEEAEADRE